MKRVLIIAGGTVGHIFPGLAIARALRRERVSVHWLGKKLNRISRQILQETGQEATPEELSRRMEMSEEEGIKNC